MADFIQVFTTTAHKEEAEVLARALVERRVAACVQVFGPLTSVYRWQGEVETSAEWLCVAKTRQSLYKAIEAAIRELHSYEVPEIIALPIVAGSAAYLSWLEAETQQIPPRTAGRRRRLTRMYAFHITIHARPQETSPGPALEIDGRIVGTLHVPPAALGITTFDCSFEAVVQRLSQLDRMYCEPDGSFVWVASQRESPWQVDGNLYDKSERLLFVDAKGPCPADQFDRLLTALGWPQTPLMFQLVRQAVFLDEAELRRLSGQD